MEDLQKGTAFTTHSLRELCLDVWEPVQGSKLKKGKKTFSKSAELRSRSSILTGHWKISVCQSLSHLGHRYLLAKVLTLRYPSV